MMRALDLARLNQLSALCDARYRLAIQDVVMAEEEAHAATLRQKESEMAVTQAEQLWHGALVSRFLDPDRATAAGQMLIAQAGRLTVSAEREADARRMLAAREDALLEARARLEQVESVAAHCRQQLQRRADERELAASEDRTAYRWRRA